MISLVFLLSETSIIESERPISSDVLPSVPITRTLRTWPLPTESAYLVRGFEGCLLTFLMSDIDVHEYMPNKRRKSISIMCIILRTILPKRDLCLRFFFFLGASSWDTGAEGFFLPEGCCFGLGGIAGVGGVEGKLSSAYPPADGGGVLL